MDRWTIAIHLLTGLGLLLAGAVLGSGDLLLQASVAIGVASVLIALRAQPSSAVEVRVRVDGDHVVVAKETLEGLIVAAGHRPPVVIEGEVWVNGVRQATESVEASRG